MAGHGAPTPSQPLDGSGLTIALVHGTWHESIANGLLEGARRALAESGARVVEIEAPGAFELPVLCQHALQRGADGAVALGVIIRGGTPHFEYVSAAATHGLTQVALSTGKPVGFGVLTVDDEQQGIDRAGFADSKEDKGREAAEAVLATALTLSEIAL